MAKNRPPIKGPIRHQLFKIFCVLVKFDGVRA